MPQAAIGYIAGIIFSSGALSAAASIFIAKVFVYAASAYLLNMAARALAPKQRGVGLIGSEINYFDTGAAIRIAYGQVRTGGMETIPPITSGNDQAFLHKVLTLTGHEIDSYNYTHFDTTTISNDEIGAMAFTGSDGAVNSGFFANHAWVRRYRGTSTDSADRMLMDVDSAAFNNSRARGISKAAITMKYNADIYRSVPAITFTYQGARCYDPRLDSSPGADPTNASYIAWTRNPALCLCNYLMATYGGEYASSDIDWGTVVTAANYCDGTVSTPSGNQSRYTCNGVLFATESFEENVKELVDAMLGRIIFRDGKWRIYAGSWQTPTFSIQKSDWIDGGLSIRFEQGRARRFNRMRCWYIDPERDWQRVECLPRSNSTYRAADGDETIDAETEQLMCTSEYEAQRKAEFLLRQSRNQITVTGRLPPRFQDIALWDTGTIVFDHLGWSSKTFRAIGIDLNPDGSMDCVFTEEQSSDWTDLSSGSYNAPSTAALPAPNATTPSAPAGFSVTAQINGTLLFEWNDPVVKPIGTQIEIIRSTNSADASVGTVVWRGDTSPVALVMPTSIHWYWIRSRGTRKRPAPFSGVFYSAYTPNTYGVAGISLPTAEHPFLRQLIPDPTFIYGSASSLWISSDVFGETFNTHTGNGYLDTGGPLGKGAFDAYFTSAFGGRVITNPYMYTTSLGIPITTGLCAFLCEADIRVNSLDGNPDAVSFGLELREVNSVGTVSRQVAGSAFGEAFALGQWKTYRGFIALSNASSGSIERYARPNVAFRTNVYATVGRVKVDQLETEFYTNTGVAINSQTFLLGGVSKYYMWNFDNRSYAGAVEFSGWDRIPLGTQFFLAKVQTRNPVYFNPNTLSFLMANRTSTGTVTMATSEYAHAWITKNGSDTAFFSGAAIS